jgi:hypothetical protein
MDRDDLERLENTKVVRLPSKPGVKVWMVGFLLLGFMLGIAFVWGINPGNIFPSLRSDLDHPVGHDHLSSLYEEFQCPCCDQNIGECTCGLAETRRDIISSMAILGTSRRAIYQFMFLYDGSAAFFDQELASEVGAWLEELLPETRPVINIEPLTLDMGTVSMAEGLISKSYQLKNTGQSDLTINNLVTSCMCTTVVLETSDGLSPTFDAHQDGNPDNWSVTLSPNEEAELIVTFDPNAHGPEAVGQVRRLITVSSNDPLQPAKKVEIVADVVP